jgi:excisionase family DNA binding protein
MTVSSITEPKTLTLKQTANALGVSEALVRKWQRLGKIRIVRLGRCVRVPQEEVVRIAHGGIQ